VLFDSDSTNIGPIANLNAGGERAGNTGQSRSRTCHDTIRTQIINWSEAWRNFKAGTAGRVQPGQKARVYVWSGYQTRQDNAVRVFVLFWNRTEPNRLPKTGLLVGYPDPLLTLTMPQQMVQANEDTYRSQMHYTM
jgi:hypothetical protein